MAETDPKRADRLGLLVRRVWVGWARQQPDAKPSWLVGWEDIEEPQREVDMLIGEALYAEGRAAATDQVREMADLCRELLSASLWYEPGHPGSPCHRTGWVEDDRLATWRQRLAQLLGEVAT